VLAERFATTKCRAAEAAPCGWSRTAGSELRTSPIWMPLRRPLALLLLLPLLVRLTEAVADAVVACGGRVVQVLGCCIQAARQRSSPQPRTQRMQQDEGGESQRHTRTREMRGSLDLSRASSANPVSLPAQRFIISRTPRG
jgi:hypothetical protein